LASRNGREKQREIARLSGQLLDSTLKALKRYGITPKRGLGQCYVVDPDLVSCILQTAKIGVGETVLEIGAGTGNLTEELAFAAGRVIAVEKEAKAAAALRDRFSVAGNVEVVNSDILLMDLPRVDKVVSNLPYSISTPITFKLLLYGSFKSAVLTYQKEVADRLDARAGGSQYSRLSVAVSLLAEVEKIREFSPGSFYPRPKVSSTVVLMRKVKAGEGGIDWVKLDETLKVLFSQRRRKLRKALQTYSKMMGVEFGEVIARVCEGIDPIDLGRRVYELQPTEFVRLSRRLGDIGNGQCTQATTKQGRWMNDDD